MKIVLSTATVGLSNWKILQIILNYNLKIVMNLFNLKAKILFVFFSETWLECPTFKMKGMSQDNQQNELSKIYSYI
jgi:hypothetical protein